MLIIPAANDVQSSLLLVPQWPFGQIPERVATLPYISLDRVGRVDNGRRVEDRIEKRSSVGPSPSGLIAYLVPTAVAPG